MSDKESLKHSRKTELFDQLLTSLNFEFSENQDEVSILEWAKKVMLGARPFHLEDHEYQIDLLKEQAPRQCYKKGAQMGITETQVLKTMWGLIYSRYPQGVLYLFPTVNDVTDFSKGRFSPLLEDNPDLNSHVQTTDAATVKRVRKSMLYLRGARATSRIEGIKKSSSQLKGVPVDRVVFDEVDEMEPAMVELALERLGHSMVKEEAYLSTPSIPDFGIDKLYNESDQRVWTIKCEHCGTETCLEIEFPTCLLEFSDGRVIRACKKCKQEIFSRNGHWVAQYPGRSKDMVGWWVSQLNSVYVDPGKILRQFNDTSRRNLQEFYNSKLGMAWISAENRLSIQDVYSNCSQDPMTTRDPGPCAMGVDVGGMLHVVVGYKPKDKMLQACYLVRVSTFDDLHDIAKRFNVKCAVIDAEPETRKAREWQQSEPFPVYLCDYAPISSGIVWDSQKKLVKAHRTETLDEVHDILTTSGRLTLPRRCEEVEEFARELINVAKVLEEDQETGSREYRYRKLGPDHYAHALNYFILATSKIGVSSGFYYKKPEMKAITEFDVFNYDHQDS
jgi:hypothetical protein